MNGQFSSLDEFWPFYLSQHLDPTNRRLHFAGTATALALLALAAFADSGMIALAAPAAGYGFAWLGHFRFEKNHPATLRYPLLSLRADLRMFAAALRSDLDAEIRRREPEIRRYRDGG